MSLSRWQALAGSALLVAAHAVCASTAGNPPPVPSPLDARLALASRYLHAQVEIDGRFIYRRDAVSGRAEHGRYNLLRHAGTVLALAEYHLEHPATPQETAAITRSLNHLRSCCMAPSGAGADDLAVWSAPDTVGGPRSYPVAKLGGAGLALAAMAQWRRLQPDAVALADMQALARFILSMQQPDGRFRSLHAHHTGEHDPDWVSLYYPGEAALGLLLLHDHDPNPRWLEAALDALRALAREREFLQHPPPDHWALLATAALWNKNPSLLASALPPPLSWHAAPGRTAVAPLLMAHGLSVTRFMLDEQAQAQHSGSCAPGGFTSDGRTTPTATRLEGLLAFLPLLPAGAERDAVLAAVQDGMGFLLQAQRLEGPARGGFSRVSPVCSTDDRRASEVRIDYVQHAMAALQAYRKLLPAVSVPGSGEPRLERSTSSR
ncbi:MAG: hypothetical protein MUF76_13240 [Hydrogenophaga sp.]|nr:hypothetical protein [Hydrogenophaga sp.]